jgi:ABC-type antimicrobial peptide transport system permease subunit
MSRGQALQRGAALMVLGALIFLVYSVVFLLRAFASSGFELGVETLNGVTTQQLNGLNPAIMAYVTHLHVATAGFIAATAIAAGGLAWYGVRGGLWWAWITAVISPVVGLVVALPMHWMGHFNYDWTSHLGPIYLGTIIYVVGAAVALIGLSQAAPVAASAGR